MWRVAGDYVDVWNIILINQIRKLPSITLLFYYENYHRLVSVVEIIFNVKFPPFKYIRFVLEKHFKHNLRED